MTHYCKYHVLDEAAWHCPTCRVEFCPTCSPDLPGQEDASHYCLLCNGELKRISLADSAAPFWQRLTDILRYPFSPVGIGLLVLAFLAPLLAGAGSAAFIAGAVVLLAAGKLGWTALEQTASGDLEPVAPEKLIKGDNNSLAIGAGLVLVVMAAVVGFLYGKWPVYATTLAVLCLLALPLQLVAIGVNRNVAGALNAESLKASLAGIGPVYVVVALFSLLLFAGLQSVVSILSDILPVVWARALMLTTLCYFTVVVFVLAGYLLMQYQEALGFTPAGSAKSRRSVRKVDPAVVTLEIALKEGNYARALGILRKESEKKGAGASAHENYHRLLLLMNDENGLRSHALTYFRMLLESGRDTQAQRLLRDYIERFPGYRPEDPDLCLDLAESMERLGDFKLAVHVLNGLHKDAPHYARLPEAYLMAARLLAEKLNLPQKSMALLQFLDGRFKTHKSYPEIQAAMRALGNAPRLA